MAVKTTKTCVEKSISKGFIAAEITVLTLDTVRCFDINSIA